jgi:hypothetical protein
MVSLSLVRAMSRAVAVVGFACVALGTVRIALADQDNTCYGTANQNVGGNWINGTYACNTTTCPPGGGTTCAPREAGASTRYPGYNGRFCSCDETGNPSGIRCELVWYYNPEDPANDFFAACLIDKCTAPQLCKIETVSGMEKRCTCQ